MKKAEYWIDRLNLLAHPEGGFYKETYRAEESIAVEALPQRFNGKRNFATSIYFLLRSEDCSMFHRIKSDELWHYHAGSSLSIYALIDGKLEVYKLGSNPEQGESLQVVIPANCWFGAKVHVENSYVLAGCTVSPGFDFNDFELAKRNELLLMYPEHAEIIIKLTSTP
jgi:uncharacterized protein